MTEASEADKEVAESFHKAYKAVKEREGLILQDMLTGLKRLNDDDSKSKVEA
jgi:hypothetical protein